MAQTRRITRTVRVPIRTPRGTKTLPVKVKVKITRR